MKHEEKLVKANILLRDSNLSLTSSDVNREGDRLILSGQNLSLVDHGIIVDVAAFSEDGLWFMKGQVTLSTPYQVNLTILSEEEKEDRRKYIRVKVHNRILLAGAFSMGKLKKPFRIGEQMEIRDINIGGIGFYSNKRLLKKQLIELDFGFLKKDLMMEAQVLRIERMEIPLGYRYKYGCAFQFRNTEEERVVCEFVFKVQIQNHRRAMNLDED